MKWYEQSFINRRDWILENLEYLGLSAKEVLIVLLIDFCNEHRIEITTELMARKTGMSSAEVEETITLLCARRYMEIRASGKRVRFVLNGLFEVDTERDRADGDQSLFGLFESEFGRPLSQKEAQRISDWNRTYEHKMIVEALREASTYQKMNFAYIESILHRMKTDRKTADGK